MAPPDPAPLVDDPSTIKRHSTEHSQSADLSIITEGPSAEHPAQTSDTPTQPLPSGQFSFPDVPDHEVLAAIGAGGFGIVYKAHDCKLNRLVAIKVLRGGALNSTAIERFRQEAQAMAQLDHPHIVPVFARGECRSEPYFTMQFMAGGSLAEHKDEFLQDPRRAVEVLRRVARAVQYLHERNILHRDLKLKNILFAEDGEPHVSDFGLAKLLDNDVELTTSGEMLGTMPYMAPEQLRGRAAELGPRADIWALGVMLYELLSGRRPFTGESRDSLRQNILTQELPPLGLTQGQPLEPVVSKCLAKDPRERFASAGELADELERWLNGAPLHTQPRSWWQRARSDIRRRPRVAIGVAGLVAAALSLLVIRYVNDPQRTVEAIQQDVRAGRTAALLDETHSPRWQRWRIVPGALMTPAGPDAARAFHTQNLTILELLPGTGNASYRFAAEVRHDQGDLVSSVGLVIGLHSHTHNEETVTQFVTLSFNDLEWLTAKDNPAPLLYWVARSKKQHDPLASDIHDARLLWGPVFAPSEKRHGTGRWRALEVSVRPERVSIGFNGRTIGELSRAQIEQKLDLSRQDVPKFQDVAVAFQPTAGLGLFINQGEAAFRNVRLEPVAADDP